MEQSRVTERSQTLDCSKFNVFSTRDTDSRTTPSNTEITILIIRKGLSLLETVEG